MSEGMGLGITVLIISAYSWLTTKEDGWGCLQAFFLGAGLFLVLVTQ